MSYATNLFIPGNGGSVFIQETDTPNNNGAVRSLGQTFVAPAGANVLTDFAFTFTSGTSSGFDYRGMLFQWNQGALEATGAALFTSAAQNGSQAPSFTGLNIALTPGVTYIALITTQGVVNNAFDGALLVSNSGGNPYANGGAYQQTSSPSNGSTGAGSWTTTTWSAAFSANDDFQFNANFQSGVPEPGALGLLLTGAAAFVGFTRLRTSGRK